jgi:hypothetical protein
MKNVENISSQGWQSKDKVNGKISLNAVGSMSVIEAIKKFHVFLELGYLLTWKGIKMGITTRGWRGRNGSMWPMVERSDGIM